MLSATERKPTISGVRCLGVKLQVVSPCESDALGESIPGVQRGIAVDQHTGDARGCPGAFARVFGGLLRRHGGVA